MNQSLVGSQAEKVVYYRESRNCLFCPSEFTAENIDQLRSELIRLSVKKFRIENFCFNISIQVPQIPPTVSEWERGVGMMANEWLVRFRGNINKKRKRIQERLINRY